MRSLVVGTVLVLAVGIGGPASADRAVVKDDTLDVHSPEGAHAWTDEGSVVNTDVKRTTVTHRARSVKVVLSYVDLETKVSDEIDVDAVLQTGSGTEFSIHVSVDYLFRGAYVHVQNLTDYGEVECEKASATASHTKERITFVVPRVCLGHPRTVRFLAEAHSYTEGGGLFVDNVMGPTPQPSSWTRRLRAG